MTTQNREQVTAVANAVLDLCDALGIDGTQFVSSIDGAQLVSSIGVVDDDVITITSRAATKHNTQGPVSQILAEYFTHNPDGSFNIPIVTRDGKELVGVVTLAQGEQV